MGLNKLSIFFILLLMPAANSLAQTGGSRIFGFLDLPGSAKTAALGGNHVSLQDGGVSLFTANPAYLNKNIHKQLSVSYTNHLYDIYMGSADFAYHVNGIGTLASGIRWMNYGEFTRTDREGFETGSFHAYDLSWSTALSREIVPGFHAAAGIRLITGRYDAYHSEAAGLFAGMHYRFNGEQTVAGLTVQNAGSQLSRFDDTREKLPFSVTAGISHRLTHLPLRFNLAVHSLEQWKIPVFDDESTPGFSGYLLRHLRGGIEMLFSDHFHMRAGYDHLKNEELKTDRRIDLSGASFGMGLGIRDLTVDFSRASYSETGGLFQVSVSIGL